MKVKNVIFRENSFGITQKSLKILRNTLTFCVNHPVAVVELPTNDLCCGFFIFDKYTELAVFTGDGFRKDRAGEGGAGYNTAEALFGVFGIRRLIWDEVNLDEIYQGKTEIIRARLLKVAQEIANTLTNTDFVIPADKNPQYVRR
ncbi:MAG: hypothetical protein DRG69_01545 [Deltaproteobacteria bacterium]|nr:MAG: hypothetical protein DRG69_01545 [Deltaproteobacteria bacterium]